jgi:hypothetical protein
MDLVYNVESEQVHVLFQDLPPLLQLVSPHSKMFQEENVIVMQDLLHHQMDNLVNLVQKIVLLVHLNLNVLYVIVHLH